jgi:predicted porin
MNFKKTTLALAMAGIVAAPMIAQAESGFYGSIRQGIVSSSNDAPGSDTSLSIANRGSRLGFAGETDLGNGMTGFGKYEYGVNTSGTADTVTRRKAYVGIKGDFGSVRLGQDYHTYYNHVNGAVDIANWNSGFHSIGRTNQAITYAGEFGPVSLGVTAYARSDDNPAVAGGGDTGLDGTELGASFNAGPVKIGLGLKGESNKTGPDAEDKVGITVSGNAGPVYLAVSLQMQDKVKDTTEISASFGQGYLIYGVEDLEGNNAEGDGPTNLTLGYSLPVGPQTNAWFEYTTRDADTTVASAADTSSIEAILKYNWN